MPSCAIFTCQNHKMKTQGTCIRYFRFPKDKVVANDWYLACGRQDKINFNIARICSVHFDRSCYEVSGPKQLKYAPEIYRSLKSDAIPTLRLPRSVRRDEHDYVRRAPERRHRQRPAVEEIDDDVFFADDDQLPPEVQRMTDDEVIAMVKELLRQVKKLQLLSAKLMDREAKALDVNRLLWLRYKEIHRIAFGC